MPEIESMILETVVLKKEMEGQAINVTLTLPFEKRQKSRYRATLNNGDDVAVMIERGLVLRDGDCLKSDNGQIVKIIAADENVSTVKCDNAFDQARAAYHLGNRHVSLQVGTNWLRYLKDHVLDEMVEGFGLKIKYEAAPFEPEIGAYHSQQHHHAHE